MKEIFKSLSKFTIPIIIVICLLFVQAMCDLALPDYTSKIVNVGIQQSGIEDIVPVALSKSEYEKLLLFTNDSGDSLLNKSYKLVLQGNGEYKNKYSKILDEDIYVLEDIDNDIKNELKDTLILPIVFISSLNSENFDMSKLGVNNFTSFNEIKNSDPFIVLNIMDKSSRDELIKSMSENFKDVETSLLEQSAINYVKDIYNEVGLNVDNLQIHYITMTGLKMIGIALAIMFITIVVTYISSRVAAGFSKDLRSKVVNKVMTFFNKEFENFSTASLITRSTNDIQQIQMLIVMLLRIVIYAPILGFGALGHVSKSSLAWVIALAVLTILSVVIILFSIALPKFQKVQKLIDRLNLVAREIITGLPVIRAFATENYEIKRFDVANKDLTKVNLFVNRVMTVMMPTMMFIMNGVCVLIIWVGAKSVDIGSIQVGTLLSFITYTMQIITSFLMISMMSIMLPRAAISFKRIKEIFKTDLSVKEVENPSLFMEDKKGIVEFKDVYFRYPDAEEDVLQNISFKAMPGTTTAFIGSTGSGKSTLINLIPRFFDVTGGKILIDGVNIKDVKLHDLRDKIGYVPQKGQLFSGTIASNIGFGKEDINEEELIKAAEVSQALEFIKNKPKGFQEEISEGGTNVSGGQRQRLAIARALAINPEILIFDDSFSALDFKTDYKLRLALSKEIKNATIFIVAQRISTIMKADQIIVLNKGEIVGIGTHKELIKTCEVYKEIATSQLGKEELENA